VYLPGEIGRETEQIAAQQLRLLN